MTAGLPKDQFKAGRFLYLVDYADAPGDRKI